MNDTHKCVERREFAILQSKAALWDEAQEQEKKPKQWEPPKGSCLMNAAGETISATYPQIRDFGMTFTSDEQAEEAKPLIRARNRLIRYVQEHGGIQPFVKGTENWTVDLANMCKATSWNMEIIGAIYMTEFCAVSLVAGLKDGSIIL